VGGASLGPKAACVVFADHYIPAFEPE